MEIIGTGIVEAFRLIFSGDSELFAVTILSLKVSLSAIAIAVVLGIPLGGLLSYRPFKGRGILLAGVNTLMGLPPVVAGLFVMMLLWRGGPVSELAWLYEPQGMIFAQAVIALPIVTGLSATAYGQLHPDLKLQSLALGASHLQTWWQLTKEARLSLLAAVMAGMGRVFAEVGAVLIVGGNIKGQTRVLTTAIVMESRKGNFAGAVALSVILMLIAFAISGTLTYMQQSRNIRQ